MSKRMPIKIKRAMAGASVLGAKRGDVLIKAGLPPFLFCFDGSLIVAIALAFVGNTVSEIATANEGIGDLLILAGSSM